MPMIAPQRLSEIIADIYDCSIDPDRWPDIMRELCVGLRCVGGTILLVDPAFSSSVLEDVEL